ncbi:hypothetical protein N321_03806, partial [Antrostomus carolinensis]
NTPGKLWTTGQDGETQTSHSDLTPSPTTTVGSARSEIQAAEMSTSQGTPFPSSGKTLGMKAVKKISNPTTPTPASQSNGHRDGDSDKNKMRSSSSSKGTSLQSNAGKVSLQQEVTTSQDTATGNRSLKQSSHTTGITSAQQDANSQASGFETT